MRDDPRIERMARSLAPPMRIEGETIAWTIEERLAHYDCPGVGVAVIEDGKLAWAEGFGRLEKGAPGEVGRDTLFSGASISKPFTAALALMFVQDGRFELDTDVNRYLRSWQVETNAFTRETPVTLRALLSHTAGTTGHGFGAFPPGRPLPTALDTLLGREPAMTGPVVVDKQPGGTTRYSGGGTTIVQLMLEEASGMGFAELARRRLLDPLGLHRTTFVNPLPAALRADAAVGHENGETIDGKYVCVPQLAAGGVWTTAAEFATFMIACRDAALGREDAFLSPTLAREMMTRVGQGFGLGWELFGDGPRRLFGHGGSNAGYQCEALCQMQSGNGAVVLTNAESGLILYWEVFAAVAAAHGWRDFLPPAKTPDPIGPEELERYVGEFDIVSGVEMPSMRVWVEDGALRTHIEGMRGGPNRPLRDQNGRLFNRTRPSETEVVFGPDGRAQELIVRQFGMTEIMRMRRRHT